MFAERHRRRICLWPETSEFSMLEDDERVEEMLEYCMDLLGTQPGLFNEWELEFLESIEDLNDVFHLTDRQRDKLEEIYIEKKVGGQHPERH